MASPIRDVDRSRVNQSIINAPDPGKSGFNLSYKSFNHYQLGKLHISGFQWCMPGDKIQGSNDSFAYFERLVTPMLSEVNCSQHSFFLPLRALDRTFEDATPNKNNSYASSWSAAHWSLVYSIKEFIKLVRDTNFACPISLNSVLTTAQVAAFNLIRTRFTDVAYLSGIWSSTMQQHYVSEFISDFVAYCKVTWPNQLGVSNTLGQAISFVLRCLSPIFGSGSLIDSLGYNYIRESDILTIYNGSTSSTVESPTLANWLDQLLDGTPMNEYLIRMYYATWYEKYRVNSVEPKSSTLPNWRDFGSSSIVNSSNHFGWIFLITRSRSWMEDMFTTAQIDDPCRHVFAPIACDCSVVSESSNLFDYMDAESYESFNPPSFDAHNVQSFNISYLNSNGSLTSVVCPLPSRVNDFLSHNNVGDADAFSLDLLNLRQAFALERYLKRIFYFGDEYQDYILAHYGSKVNDLRINKPELVGASINGAKYNQEVANVTTDGSMTGDRVATGTIEGHGDGYSFFAEEFGILIHFISFMPVPQYAGVCAQNMIEKMVDFPIPEFAQNNEEFGRIMEIASSGLAKSDVQKRCFGHYPYAHSWRGRVDEVHGHFLDSKQNFTFRRYFGMDSANNIPKLNSAFMHCVPNLGMFADSVRFNGQLYGWTNHNCYVERVLPVPVENI